MFWSYSWNINCTDQAGNVGNSSIRSFTINAEGVVSTSSGGGGGGGSTSSPTETSTTTETNTLEGSETSEPTVGIINKEYTRELKKDDMIKFKIQNMSHSLKVVNVTKDKAYIIIRSDPIKVTLNIGEELKLNLSPAEDYVLYIKLNDITNGNVNLTIQEIKKDLLDPSEIAEMAIQ